MPTTARSGSDGLADSSDAKVRGRAASDLAVEIVSPSTARIDRGRKRDLLARYGVPEYWVVDPHAGAVEIGVLAGGRYGPPAVVREGTFSSLTIHGLTIDLAPLFEGM